MRWIISHHVVQSGAYQCGVAMETSSVLTPPPPLPPTPYTPQTPTPPPPPAWLQTGRRKIKRGKKHFGGSDNNHAGWGWLGAGAGGCAGGEEEQDIREQCLRLGEQLVSRLAKYRCVCFGVWRFSYVAVAVGCFVSSGVVCLRLSLFPLISAISMPSTASECELIAKEVAVKSVSPGDTVNINTMLGGEKKTKNNILQSGKVIL